jgi:hypothetical protein
MYFINGFREIENNPKNGVFKATVFDAGHPRYSGQWWTRTTRI